MTRETNIDSVATVFAEAVNQQYQYPFAVAYREYKKHLLGLPGIQGSELKLKRIGYDFKAIYREMQMALIWLNLIDEDTHEILMNKEN